MERAQEAVAARASELKEAEKVKKHFLTLMQMDDDMTGQLSGSPFAVAAPQATALGEARQAVQTMRAALQVEQGPDNPEKLAASLDSLMQVLAGNCEAAPSLPVKTPRRRSPRPASRGRSPRSSRSPRRTRDGRTEG